MRNLSSEVQIDWEMLENVSWQPCCKCDGCAGWTEDSSCAECLINCFLASTESLFYLCFLESSLLSLKTQAGSFYDFEMEMFRTNRQLNTHLSTWPHIQTYVQTHTLLLCFSLTCESTQLEEQGSGCVRHLLCHSVLDRLAQLQKNAQCWNLSSQVPPRQQWLLFTTSYQI